MFFYVINDLFLPLKNLYRAVIEKMVTLSKNFRNVKVLKFDSVIIRTIKF